MEEQKEEKWIHIENVGKSLFTTIIGSVIMALAVAALIINWYFPTIAPPVPYYVLLIVFMIGFILLFMRDKAKDYVDVFIKRKIEK